MDNTQLTPPNEATDAPPPVDAVGAAQVVPQPSIEDVATRNYLDLLPSFRTQIEHMSGNQAKKVLIAMMEYPFEKTDFHWSYPEARRAFVTGVNILDCRFVLTKAVIELTTGERRDILEATKDDVEPKLAPPEQQGVNV